MRYDRKETKWIITENEDRQDALPMGKARSKQNGTSKEGSEKDSSSRNAGLKDPLFAAFEGAEIDQKALQA